MKARMVCKLLHAPWPGPCAPWKLCVGAMYVWRSAAAAVCKPGCSPVPAEVARFPCLKQGNSILPPSRFSAGWLGTRKPHSLPPAAISLPGLSPARRRQARLLARHWPHRHPSWPAPGAPLRQPRARGRRPALCAPPGCTAATATTLPHTSLIPHAPATPRTQVICVPDARMPATYCFPFRLGAPAKRCDPSLSNPALRSPAVELGMRPWLPSSLLLGCKLAASAGESMAGGFLGTAWTVNGSNAVTRCVDAMSGCRQVCREANGAWRLLLGLQHQRS
jgi:hypothetical protein